MRFWKRRQSLQLPTDNLKKYIIQPESKKEADIPTKADYATQTDISDVPDLQAYISSLDAATKANNAMKKAEQALIIANTAQRQSAIAQKKSDLALGAFAEYYKLIEQQMELINARLTEYGKFIEDGKTDLEIANSYLSEIDEIKKSLYDLNKYIEIMTHSMAQMHYCIWGSDTSITGKLEKSHSELQE